MIKKVKVIVQELPGGSAWSSAVRVKMNDGKEYTEQVDVPKGNELENPLTREEKREKYRVNANFSKKVKMDNAEKALGMIEKLEGVKDIREIIKLLVP